MQSTRSQKLMATLVKIWEIPSDEMYDTYDFEPPLATFNDTNLSEIMKDFYKTYTMIKEDSDEAWYSENSNGGLEFMWLKENKTKGCIILFEQNGKQVNMLYLFDQSARLLSWTVEKKWIRIESMADRVSKSTGQHPIKKQQRTGALLCLSCMKPIDTGDLDRTGWYKKC